VKPLVARSEGQRGFTLLELLMTLTVTTIGLVGDVAAPQHRAR
jgi:prepilin-type N-terminal cleavage/methylation domain-containing protein